MTKYLLRVPFLNKDTFLCQAFQKEINFEKRLKLGCINHVKKTCESYGLLNWYINVKKVVKGEIRAEDYKCKNKFFEKHATDIYI